jgi:hypothetical protein
MVNEKQDEVNNSILYVWEFNVHYGVNSHSTLLNADICALIDEETRLRSLIGQEASISTCIFISQVLW